MVPFENGFIFIKSLPSYIRGMGTWTVLSSRRWKSPYFRLTAEELVVNSP